MDGALYVLMLGRLFDESLQRVGCDIWMPGLFGEVVGVYGLYRLLRYVRFVKGRHGDGFAW